MLRGVLMNRGIIFSLEAILSGIIFCIILLSMSNVQSDSLKELLIVQQGNDLLKIWSTDFPTNTEIISDTQALFDNASVSLDGTEILKAKSTGMNKISLEEIIVDDFLVERRIRIIVYYE
jgi:hypothetical protein